jgi:hypothetical protein
MVDDIDIYSYIFNSNLIVCCFNLLIFVIIFLLNFRLEPTIILICVVISTLLSLDIILWFGAFFISKRLDGNTLSV